MVTSNLVFKKLDNVNNQSSIHGIYPYRGKISPIDAAQVLDQIPSNVVLLDPFCGSGTIVYEAARRGMKAIGVDSNPIAVQIAKSKLCQCDTVKAINELRNIIGKIDLNIRMNMPEKASRFFHSDTANEIMHLLYYYNDFNDYEKAVFLGTVCLTARACNNYRWSSTQIGKLSERKQYINFFDKFLRKIIKHAYQLKSHNARIIEGDSRQLSSYLDHNSVDIVYTSPPYFDALDYTSYYTRIIHHLFENDVVKIKSRLIQDRSTYEDDMLKCLDEIWKVTNEHALIIFIVGDKKFGDTVINGGEFFSTITDHKPIRVVERVYTKTASKIWDKINKTKRKEQIVIWDKSKW